MPSRKYTPSKNKLDALSFIDPRKSSIRSAVLAASIGKSPLFDNLPKFRDSVVEFSNWHSSSEKRLICNNLAIAMEGKASARDTATVLSRIEGKHIDHHRVFDILATQAD